MAVMCHESPDGQQQSERLGQGVCSRVSVCSLLSSITLVQVIKCGLQSLVCQFCSRSSCQRCLVTLKPGPVAVKAAQQLLELFQQLLDCSSSCYSSSIYCQSCSKCFRAVPVVVTVLQLQKLLELSQQLLVLFQQQLEMFYTEKIRLLQI